MIPKVIHNMSESENKSGHLAPSPNYLFKLGLDGEGGETLTSSAGLSLFPHRALKGAISAKKRCTTPPSKRVLEKLKSLGENVLCPNVADVGAEGGN